MWRSLTVEIGRIHVEQGAIVKLGLLKRQKTKDKMPSALKVIFCTTGDYKKRT